ncbi:hypothetical protein IMCC1989_31 [gamma proteobacterium IMCC1989]|nr:hypothetical protein IMCC1989_31 [gamma proteobacterium IMCC1989]
MVVDASEAPQSYIEDCFVCCRPINVTVTVENNHHGENEEVMIEVKSEDDV